MCITNEKDKSNVLSKQILSQRQNEGNDITLMPIEMDTYDTCRQFLIPFHRCPVTIVTQSQM